MHYVTAGAGSSVTPTSPPTTDGYDSVTAATDLTELMAGLGHDRNHVHGEDRGAEYAYVLAATHPDRVRTLSFAVMLLSGYGVEEWSTFSPEHVSAQYQLRSGSGTFRSSGCRISPKCSSTRR
jgi:pimeloyl-ACP methyl ester carboxylesterase